MTGVPLKRKERTIIENKDIGRLATISSGEWPHVVPVSYVYSGGMFYVPSAEGAVKVGDIRRTPRTTLVIDDESSESGIMLECAPVVLPEDEAERWRVYMRVQKGWQNDKKTCMIRLGPVRKASWSLKG